MKIVVNDKEQIIREGINIKYMLEDLGIDTQNLAVAINENVISKNHWEKYLLDDNDNVILIKATKGG